MRAHIIENGKIANTIVVDSLDILPNLIDADLHGGQIGDSWDGQTITPKPPEPELVPESVTMRQARLALLNAGVLASVDAAVAQTGDAAKIEWEYAQTVERDWPLVVQLATALSLDLDALMIAAGKL